MDHHINRLIAEINKLEDQLEIALAAKRADLEYHLEGKRVVFEETIAKEHALIKTRLLTYLLEARLFMILTAPFIYVIAVPLALLDLLVTIYQFICFPVYGIPKVARADYLIFDRANLKYLNAIEKFNCAYCSYGNGVIAYAREVASRTEQYWCPIKHARRVIGTHSRYSHFVDFGDARAYHDQLEKLRTDLHSDIFPNHEGGNGGTNSGTAA